MHELSELWVAKWALERPVAIMEAKMSLEIRGGGESLATIGAWKRLLASMHENMLLKVSELREALGTRVALERPFASVHSQMHLEIRQLAERLRALFALVDDFSVLFAQWIRQRLVSAHFRACRRWRRIAAWIRWRVEWERRWGGRGRWRRRRGEVGG